MMRMAPLMLLPMPAVTRWGRGAGVAGVRAVWHRRWDGRISAPCMIRGVSAAKRAPPWQDLRAVHSRKALCRAFRIHGAHILPKPARFGCTAAICCQGGALFPSGALSGMHGAKKLPRQGVRERIARKYCHGRPPGNAPRRNIAAGGRWGTQRTGAGWCGVRRNRACRCRQIPLARQGASAGGAKQLSGVAVGMVLSGRGRGWTEKKGATRRSAAALSPPPRQKKASVLLAFFRCLVLRLEWPGTFEATSHLPSGSPSVGDSVFGGIALHVRFADSQSARKNPCAH